MTRAAVSRALLVCALALVTGCAAPNDPIPRRRVVPAPVPDLAVRQAGGSVVLAFTIPRRSTGREPLPETPGIEIYRAPIGPGDIPGAKTPWQLAYYVPPEQVGAYLRGDRVEFSDPLNPEQLSRPGGSRLAYMVRTTAPKRAASTDSNYTVVQVYPAPPAPDGVQASATEAGILVTWAGVAEPAVADSSIAGYRVYRAAPGAAPDQGGPAVPRAVAEPLQGPDEFVRETEFLDRQVEPGEAYVYTVRSFARFGTELVSSADSLPATVAMHDTFPPGPPQGLRGTVIPATPADPEYVELSWAISPESDVTGYQVYRSERPDVPGERVNSAPVQTPAFRDFSAPAGRVYFYRVSAMDREGNQSALSPEIQVVVP